MQLKIRPEQVAIIYTDDRSQEWPVNGCLLHRIQPYKVTDGCDTGKLKKIIPFLLSLRSERNMEKEIKDRDCAQRIICIINRMREASIKLPASFHSFFFFIPTPPFSCNDSNMSIKGRKWDESQQRVRKNKTIYRLLFCLIVLPDDDHQKKKMKQSDDSPLSLSLIFFLFLINCCITQELDLISNRSGNREEGRTRIVT